MANQAMAVSYSESNPPPCSGTWSASSGNSVYTCSGRVTLKSGDSVTTTRGVTLKATGFSIAGSTIGSSSAPITIEAGWEGITTTGTSRFSASVSSSGTVSLGTAAIAGSLTSNSSITMAGGSVGGDVSSSSNPVQLTNVSVSGSVTAGGTITLTGGSVTGLVNSNCCDVITNGTNLQGGARSGSSSLSITGGTIQGDFSSVNNPATFSNVTMVSGTVVAGAISFSGSTVGSSASPVTMTSRYNAISLSGSQVYGDLTAPDSSTVNVTNGSSVIGTCRPNSTPANACRQANQLVLAWNLDEGAWTGTTGEVKDESGNNLVGTAIGGASTASINPALPAVGNQGTCRYGSFAPSSSQYVQAPHNALLTLQSSFTIGVWVKPLSLPSSGLMSILSKDENYEFHLRPDGTVNWWWQTSSPSATREFNSTQKITVGQWNHIAIRYTASQQRIYINGSLAGQASLSGTPLANNDPLQLGWDQLAGRHFNGNIDELRIYRGALTDSEIAALATERHTCQVAMQCVNDSFNTLGSDWVTSSSGATPYTPAVVDGRLRLTSNQNNVATATALQRVFPAAGNFLQIQFKYYAYNGSGADGIAVILSDASVTPQPGGYGGSLGYAQLNGTPGFAGGWLGIGVDEFGNFSNGTSSGGEGRQLGPGRQVDSVSLRGSGSGTADYRYLRGTGTLTPSIDSPSSRTAAPGHTYRITVDARTTGKGLVTVERDTGSGFVVLPNLNGFDVFTDSRQRGLPEQGFYLSLTGSTGASTNIHEIDDFQVCANQIDTVAQQIHHFDLSYSTPSLTCNPQDVTIRACLNADCSKLYTDDVTVALTANGAVWHVVDSKLTFSGGVGKAKVQATRIGESTIGVGSSTPPALSFSTTTCSTPGCKLMGVESGFVFDVPTLIANKPQAISVRAVKVAPGDPQTCVAGFAGGNKTIGFNATYENPATGTRSVSVNGESVRTTIKSAATTYTPVSLRFDSEAKASMTVNYSDAGMMNLNAYYAPTDGNENLLVMRGSDSFLSKPYGIHIETDIDKRAAAARCNEAMIAGCPVFVAAGDQFPVRFRAVGWDTDELRTAEALKNNISTPNFSLSHQSGAFKLEQSLVAPDPEKGGDPGVLGMKTYDHALGEISTVAGQTISEVGIFRLTTGLNQNVNYFGEAVDGGTSNLIGRFIPARLGVTAEASLAPSCGTAFSYQGQPMGFVPGFEPHATVTAYNRAGGTTTNYDRAPFWRLGTPAREPYRSIVVGKPALNGRLLTSGTANMAVVGADNGDGARLYRWTGEQLTYAPAVSPSSDDLPFTAAVEQTFTAAGLTDADGACHTAAGGGSCQPFTYPFKPGSEVRLGRLKVGNAHGSELHGLDLPITVESWKAIGAGATFLPEGEDSCTTGASLGQVSLRNFTGNLAQGNTAGNIGALNGGLGLISLSAPGQGKHGSAQVALPATPNWLLYDWNGDGAREEPSGLATFGIFEGPKPLIFRRELYRGM